MYEEENQGQNLSACTFVCKVCIESNVQIEEHNFDQEIGAQISESAVSSSVEYFEEKESKTQGG